MNLYSFLLIIIALLMVVGVYLLERRERRELNNRFMAKDYKEYNYYEKKFDRDVEEEENIRVEARKEREDFRKHATLEEELKAVQGKEGIDLKHYAEDFSEEE